MHLRIDQFFSVIYYKIFTNNPALPVVMSLRMEDHTADINQFSVAYSRVTAKID